MPGFFTDFGLECLNVFVERLPSSLKSVRDYRNVEHEKLKSDLGTFPWHAISIFDHSMGKIVQDHH